jgi:hypothetical protein
MLEPGEAVDGGHAEAAGRAGGGDHLVGGAAAHALGVAVAPHARGEDALVAAVHGVAHRLAHEVVAHRVHLEAVRGQAVAQPVAVVVLGERAPDVEVVAPAGELEAVVAPARGLGGERVEGHVGPLAGEERDGAWGHRRRGVGAG